MPCTEYKVDSRPSPRKSDSQILNDLFGTQISSLLLAQPEVNEGSAEDPPTASRGGRGLSKGVELAHGEVPPRGFPRFFLELR
ncbi:hypothetical protein AAFF_G00156480 [Aldrovandia affinis]|uniref:Uncharacterized protein n=1 Tax=Aldrovandia affinis TaxID=143900 RepID=A0AAD7RNM8_9TELE|nr:hypothetical protein AAFF_G00156480 [Aldrovandia affinis]